MKKRDDDDERGPRDAAEDERFAKILCATANAAEGLTFEVARESELLRKLRKHFSQVHKCTSDLDGAERSGAWGHRADCGRYALSVRPADEKLAAEKGIIDRVIVTVHEQDVAHVRRFVRGGGCQ